MTEYYDKLSRGYDELYGAEQRAKHELLSDWLKLLKGSVLDIGSGTGIINEFIKPDVLTDSSFGMLSRAEGARVVCDARFLPFRDKSFDNITCFTVLQDVINKRKVLKGFERVCRDKVLITILKKLKTREELESLFKGFEVLEFREQAKDYCFLLKVLK